jgi:4'-phosphopantetheinyl transferase
VVAGVDVWQARLCADAPQLEALRALLAPAERDRAAALRTVVLRRRFIAARAFTRAVLGGYLGAAAGELTFERGPAGKPRVLAGRLEFNVSHAGDYAVCAVADGVPVGIDIERIDAGVDVDEVAACCFAPREIAELRALAPTTRTRAFFATWTRKEAFAKALGTGMSTPLSSFAVAVDPDAPPLVTWQGAQRAAGPWSLHELAAPAGYVACLAARAADVRVRRRVWDVSSPAAAVAAT